MTITPYTEMHIHKISLDLAAAYSAAYENKDFPQSITDIILEAYIEARRLLPKVNGKRFGATQAYRAMHGVTH